MSFIAIIEKEVITLKEIKLPQKIENAGVLIVGIIAAMVSLFLSCVSLMHTTVVENVKEGEGIESIVYHIPERLESVYYLNDNLILNLLILAFILIDCFLLIKNVKKIRLRTICIGVFLWTFILGTVWVFSSQTSPTEDSGVIADAALRFAKGDYGTFEEARYFRDYAFQLGFAFFSEMIIRFASLFTELQTLMIEEVLNAAFLGVSYLFLVLITDKLVRDRRVTILAAVLLALSAAPIISCSFIYGIYPGMMFALIALYCELRYLIDNKLPFAFGAAGAMMLAAMIKPNYMIWMIAMLLIGAVFFLKRKKYLRDGIFLVLTAVLACGIRPVIIHSYEVRSGTEIKGTIPYICWIAMGLNESELAPGWYNYSYTLGLLEQSDFDEKLTAQRGMEVVKERIGFFLHHPQYTNDFFYLKNVSQWNETSYQSIWNNTVRGQYKEKGPIAAWVCGNGQTTAKKLMDLFAQLIFVGFFFGCIRMLREKNFLLAPLPVVFLGGFFYHMLAEGKSQYVLPYFIVMTCFAAAGIVWLSDCFCTRLKPGNLLYNVLGVTETAAESAPEKAEPEADKKPEPETAAPQKSDAAEAKSGDHQNTKSGKNKKSKSSKKRKSK